MIIDLLKRKKLRKKTNDGRRTLGELNDKVKSIVHEMNTTNDSDEEIVKFIIDSFSDDMVDIYNQLGYYEWRRLMKMVVEYEIEQRINDALYGGDDIW